VNFIRTVKNVISATVLIATSSIAHAGSTTVFDFSLVTAPSNVPVLSDALLVVLGLLMAVIAVRTLRSGGAYQKYLSIVVLAGGLVVGGVGVDRSMATAQTDFIFGGDGGAPCEDATGINYYNSPSVTNSCEQPAQIVPRLINEQLERCYDLVGGTCGVLQPNASCTLPDSIIKNPPPARCLD